MKAIYQHGTATSMVDHIAGETAIPEGEILIIGAGCRICHTAIEANRKGALAIGGGVYLVAKDAGDGTGDEFDAGDLVDFDASAGEAVDAGEGDAFLGQVLQDAADVDEFVLVYHYQPSAADAGS